MGLEDLIAVGFSLEEAGVLLESPFFDHKTKTSGELEKLLGEIAVLYDVGISEIREAILEFPRFVGYDHERVLREIPPIYGVDISKIKEVILRYPQFVGLNHERVLREIPPIYGVDISKIKEVILKYPQFVGLNHERVLRQKTKLGRFAGLSKEEVINLILAKPPLAGYSVKRDLAVFDVARQLEKEGFPQDKTMLRAYLRYFGKSPYVPHYNRRRISQVPNGEEPPLLKYMRRSLMYMREKK